MVLIPADHPVGTVLEMIVPEMTVLVMTGHPEEEKSETTVAMTGIEKDWNMMIAVGAREPEAVAEVQQENVIVEV